MNWNEAYKRERKMEWRDVALAIHDSVSPEQALRFYRPDLDIRHNRCPCPIHNGKDYNFSLTDSGYKCFVCGASGDVIALVKEICELSTRADAMKKINLDFNLRLPINSEITQQQNEELRKRREKAEAKRKAKEEQAYIVLMPREKARTTQMNTLSLRLLLLPSAKPRQLQAKRQSREK